MSEITFYNSVGNPIAYSEDNEHIFLFDGTPAGYLYNDSVYSYGGKHLGRYNDGWVRDNDGNCAFFTPFASGNGPYKPYMSYKPYKGYKASKPYKGYREYVPVRPYNALNWSDISSEAFFDE